MNTWIGAAHWTPGRQGNAVEQLVIHWMAGTLASTDATFLAGVREASAHYGVEGPTIHDYVKESDTAWALGVWPANLRSISIEVSAQPGRDASPETIATVIRLATDICRRHGLTAADIGKHSDFKATQCPGTVPVEAIRAAVAANLDGTTQQEEDDMPSVKDVVDGVFGKKFGRQGGVKGETSLGALVAWYDSNRLEDRKATAEAVIAGVAAAVPAADPAKIAEAVRAAVGDALGGSEITFKVPE